MVSIKTNTVQLLSLIGTTLWAANTTIHADIIRVPKDHPTIQKAIDVAGHADTILVSAGTYRERIRLEPGIKLKSDGGEAKGQLGLKRAESTIIDGGGKNGDVAGVIMAEDSKIDGFTITNVGLYDDALWKKHHATQGNEQSHEHIGHFGKPAIGIVGINCTVKNNIVHHNGDTGIGIRGAKDRDCSPRVVNNITYRNMGGGIGSMQGSTAFIDSNICYQNFYAGIGHDDASPIVTRNICFQNVRAGIGISHGASPVVRGNKCYKNRRAGIGTRTGANTRPVIENNDCYENDMAGIGSEEHASAIIRGNRCYRNKMAGIGSRTGATPLIVGNECYENNLAGIGTDGTKRALIIDNDSHDNKLAGIGVRGKSNRAVVCGNTCRDNRMVAIGVPDGASAVIVDNKLSRTKGQPPLVALRGGSAALFANNTLNGGGVAGVLVQGSVTLIENNISGGGGSGIWAWKDSNATMFNNRINGFRTGINAADSQVEAVRNKIAKFGKRAINITSTDKKPIVVGNSATSDDPKAKAVNVTDKSATIDDNQLSPNSANK